MFGFFCRNKPETRCKIGQSVICIWQFISDIKLKINDTTEKQDSAYYSSFIFVFHMTVTGLVY